MGVGVTKPRAVNDGASSGKRVGSVVVVVVVVAERRSSRCCCCCVRFRTEIVVVLLGETRNAVDVKLNNDNDKNDNQNDEVTLKEIIVPNIVCLCVYCIYIDGDVCVCRTRRRTMV
jgi:hypothetical protein